LSVGRREFHVFGRDVFGGDFAVSRLRVDIDGSQLIEDDIAVIERRRYLLVMKKR
jgi:hypothetical protein